MYTKLNQLSLSSEKLVHEKHEKYHHSHFGYIATLLEYVGPFYVSHALVLPLDSES